MNLEILGTRILVRAYSLPEQTEGGIVLPDYYRLNAFDGKSFELIQTGKQVSERIGIMGALGEKQLLGLRDDAQLEPWNPEPDDIIQLRGYFNGQYAGPELERLHGPCWFVDCIQTLTINNKLRDQCAIEWCWPAKAWREAA